MSFCSLTKGISRKNCRLRVCVLINKRSFEPFMCLGLPPSSFVVVCMSVCRWGDGGWGGVGWGGLYGCACLKVGRGRTDVGVL